MGKLLAYLKEPEPPKGLRDLWDKFPLFKQVLNMAPRVRSDGALPGSGLGERRRRSRHACRCRPAGPAMPAPLITWGLTVTRGPHKPRQNLGIYRQQVIGRDRVIMRWLAHRGGALDYRDHSQGATGIAVSRSRSRWAPIRRRCSAR